MAQRPLLARPRARLTNPHRVSRPPWSDRAIERVVDTRSHAGARGGKITAILAKQPLIPTPLPPSGVMPPLAIDADRRVDLRRSRVWLALISWGWNEFRNTLRRRDPFPDRLRHSRMMAVRFGGAWILMHRIITQLSQYVVTPAAREVIHTESFHHPPSPAVVERMIQDELGQTLDYFFERFDFTPINVSPFAIIYRARLRWEQAEVVVKVQQPGIEAAFARDARILPKLVRMLRAVRFAQHLHWRDQFLELDALINEQRDLRYEAASLRQARKPLKKQKIWVPKVFDSYTTRRMIVLEHVAAPSIAEFIELQQRDRLAASDWLAENSIVLKKLGKRLFDSLLRQILEENMFHTELNPRNILLLRDGRFALVGFGTTATLEKRFLSIYTMLLRVLQSKNYEKAADLILLMCESLPVVDIAQVKSELVRCFRTYAVISDLRKIPYEQKSMAALSAAIGHVLFRYRIRWSWDLFKVSNGLAAFDPTLCFLLPHENFLHLLQRYFTRSGRRFWQNVADRGVTRIVGGLINTTSELAMFYSSSIRREAYIFKGTISKGAYFGGSLLRALARTVLIAIALGVWVYINQYHASWVAPWADTWPVMLAQGMPSFARGTLFLFLLGALFVYTTLRRLAKRLMMLEVYLPLA